MRIESLKWIATFLSVVAALLISLDLGRKITGWTFVLFTVGSIVWVISAWMDPDPALAFTNIAMTAINIFGVYRWLIRKTG